MRVRTTYRLLFILLAFLPALVLPAQDSLPRKMLRPDAIGLQGHFGFLIAHRNMMDHLVKRHLPAVELDLCWGTNGEREWSRAYGNPDWGISIWHVWLGNPEQLGMGTAVNPYINFPLKRSTSLRVGWGVGWITKPFDAIDNHKNIAVGSHLNGTFNLRLLNEFSISRRLFGQVSIGISHFSNGAFRIPNLGLNIPTLGLGIFYDKSKRPNCAMSICPGPLPSDTTAPYIFKRWTVYAIGTLGANEEDQPDGPLRPAYGLLISAMKQTERKHRWGAGVDVMYSEANRIRLKRHGENVSEAENVQLGMKVCYELVVGRLSLPVEAGGYVLSRYGGNGSIYNRWGLRYLHSDRLMMQLSLKSHLVVADYWELGAGYRF